MAEEYMTDGTPAGAAHIVKTARAQHTLTDSDLAYSAFTLDVVWPSAFCDDAYSVALSVETVPPAVYDNYLVNSFVKSPDKVSVRCTAKGAAGDVLIVHAMAIHD